MRAGLFWILSLCAEDGSLLGVWFNARRKAAAVATWSVLAASAEHCAQPRAGSIAKPGRLLTIKIPFEWAGAPVHKLLAQ